MTEQTLRIERAVNELMNELPAGVASKEDVDEHMQRLIEDYGLSVDRAQAASRHYLTTTRERVAACLVSQLAQTTDTPPSRDAVVADLELLADWRVPLGDAYEVVRREYEPADSDDLDPAAPDDQRTGFSRGATDAEVAAAIPDLDTNSWTSESDFADPDLDDHDILDADAGATGDHPAAARARAESRATIAGRLSSIVRIVHRWLPVRLCVNHTRQT
jgi:hypothetical protein